tara:strand:+ start:35749 stop:35877 length:129 start_codon:yes stop_codon:yes gene_type:complete
MVTVMLQFDDYGTLFSSTTIKLVYTSSKITNENSNILEIRMS